MAWETDGRGFAPGAGTLIAIALAATLVLTGLPAATAQTVADHDEDDDLDVEVNIDPAKPFTDEEIETDVVVHNELNSSVGDVEVSIRVNDTHVKNVSVGVLTPDEVVVVNHTVSPLPADEHAIVAEADGTTPPNATNGTTVSGIDGRYFLVTERDQSDLRPDGILLDPLAPETVYDPTRELVEGEYGQILWDVENVGEGHSEQSVGTLSLDGEQIDRWVFDRLSPRPLFEAESHDHNPRVFVQPDAGEHEVTAVADAGDHVTELDESNNALTETITVLEEANPAVGDIRVERANLTVVGQEGPANPIEERDVTVTLTNDADDRTAQPLHVQAEVCPEHGLLNAADDVPFVAEPDETPTPFPADCDHLEDWYVDEYGAGETRTLETEWEPLGEAGDQEVCVSFEYVRPQTVERDDRDCQETSVIAGNTGLGGR